MRTLAPLVMAAAVAAGCLLVTEPWTIEDGAPVSAFGGGDDYPSGSFGEILAGGVFDVGGASRGRLAVSAGRASPTHAYDFAVEGAEAFSTRLFGEACKPIGDALPGGDPADTCSTAGSGAALLWAPRVHAGDAFLGPCLLVGEPAASAGSGRVAVHCGDETLRYAGRVAPPGGAPPGFGRTLAMLPSAGASRLVVGALGMRETSGARVVGDVYVSTGAPGDDLVPAAGTWIPANRAAIADEAKGDGYGGVLAAGATADGDGWLAVGAADGAAPDQARVYFFRPETPGDPLSRFVVAGCAEAPPASGFGSALAAGDIDGDGNDDLVVRSPDGLAVYSGADLEALTPTSDPHAPPPCAWHDAPTDVPVRVLAIRCEDDRGSGVRCSERFGLALAVGDIDGARPSEILAGDPHADVAGAARAGAVHVFTVTVGAPWTASPAATFSDAVPEPGQRLGTSIALVAGGGRAEPFVGAPGSGEVFLFRCTGLVGDRPGAADLDGRCLPR